MQSIQKALETLGVPSRDPADCPASPKRFPDGGQYRFEIPSTEGPAVPCAPCWMKRSSAASACTASARAAAS